MKKHISALKIFDGLSYYIFIIIGIILCYINSEVGSASILTGQSVPGAPLSTTDTSILSIDSGWNLISLPLKPINPHIDQLFPTALSRAYRYETGYISEDSLQCGIGYWIKFDSSQIYSLIGIQCEDSGIGVFQGWNLIGTFTDTISSSTLFIEPHHQFTTGFYLYDPDSGYLESNELYPGLGYWVKSSGPGTIVHDSNGTEWARVSELEADIFRFDPSRPDIIFASIAGMPGEADGKLFRSLNRGESWDTLLIDINVSSIRFDPVNQGTLYAVIGLVDCPGTSYRPGIIKSTDDGITWTYADSGIYIDCDISPRNIVVDWSDPNNLYSSTGGVFPGELYRSTNAGESWFLPYDPLSLECPSDPRCGLGSLLALYQNPVNPDILHGVRPWIGSGSERILKGSNAGIDWVFVNEVPNGPEATVYLDPSGGNSLYSVGWGVYRSTDSGLNWYRPFPTISDTMFYSILSIPAKTTITFLVTGLLPGLAIYRSDDLGATWSNITHPFSHLQNLIIDEINYLLYALSDKEMYRKRILE